MANTKTNFEDFLQFLEDNDLAVVKENISTKTWEYIIGLDAVEVWEQLGAAPIVIDARIIASFIKR